MLKYGLHEEAWSHITPDAYLLALSDPDVDGNFFARLFVVGCFIDTHFFTE